MTLSSASSEPRRPAVSLLGFALASSSAMLFSTKGIFIKLGYAEGLDAITLLALRMLFSVPVFLAVGLWVAARSGGSRPSMADLGAAAAVGMLGYWLASYTDFVGLETLSPQFERLILFTYPLFVVLFGAAVFGQPVRPIALVAFGVSYVGLALIFVKDYAAAGSAIAVGTAWVLVSAIAFALYQLLAKPLIRRMGAPLFTSVAMTAASAGLLVQFAATRPVEALMVSGPSLWIALGLAVGGTVLPAYLLSASLSRISAQANAVISTLSPVATLALAVAILGETVTPVDQAGTALVLGGIGLFTLLERRA
ncbi:DMT family transporter [Chthonobacter rhizosphaerae]|uniref:DMT family transporter n=1 Tax=Chthonobacter rhizosphaerae TaxID=2735553 RepID=UPI0015EFDBD2|nr:DMT family transporter [Chthonobacter rhizosphaerae]